MRAVYGDVYQFEPFQIELVMESVAFNAQLRSEINKKTTKAARKEGLVPGVIYGGQEPIHFLARPFDFRNLVYTPDFKLAEVNVDGKVYRCFLKELQMHPVTDEVVHMDMIELVPDSTIQVELPVRFRGVAPGVKEGGKLSQKVRTVKAKTTEDKLVDHVTVDISDLRLGFSVRVRDIEPVEGIEIMNSPSIPVASVEVPRALRSATSAAEGEPGVEAETEAEAEA